ncbi:MAG: Pr6Pr family membrane protein [Terracidiphilus sp.]
MFDVAKDLSKRVLMAAIALAAWFALLLQFPLSIATSRANGMTLSAAVITYFSFFTILTNLIVAIGLTFSLLAPNSRWGRFFSSTVVASGTALYIATVGAVYALLLRHSWNPEGLQKIADIILHDVVPLMYVAYWILFVAKSGLRWKDTLSWSIYPLVYLAWILLRGAISGRYPYHFVDAAQLGYQQVLLNSAMLLASFLVVGFAMVAVAKWQRPNPLNRGG